MKLKKITRRDFLEKSLKVAAGAAAGSMALEELGCSPKGDEARREACCQRRKN